MLSTDESQPRPRGRPRGTTDRGHETRHRLFEVAIGLFAERGFEATTLKDVAAAAGVSPSLLYRYFPSKAAVVLELYAVLTGRLVERCASMPAGSWVQRATWVQRASLETLEPHRGALASLAPLLVAGRDEGLFAPATRPATERVRGLFEASVTGATDTPGGTSGPALGRVLYLVHLAVLLGWLLDRSPSQRATRALLDRFERMLPALALALRLPGAAGVLAAVDASLREGFLD